jgi:glycosyltransferase involved in cell wall biosynthesis
VSPEKVDVVYDGANEIYIPLIQEEVIRIRKQYADGFPYFIFVGSIHPRKNLVNLFKGFDIFKRNVPSDIKLLVVGEKKWWTKEINQAFNGMQCADEVIFTGRLNTNELRLVLGASLALTYVSYFEGFGIPIVEAFRMQVPVITSNVTSMPEVAGDAALLVDPLNPASIADAMRQVSESRSLREDLIHKGNMRKDLFTWQKTADRLWESIEKAMN